MAAITMALPGGTYPLGRDYNPALEELLDLHEAMPVGTPTATKIVFELQNGLILRLNGTGFAFDSDGWPTAGSLTGLQLFLADGTTVLQTVTGLSLPLVDVYDAEEASHYEGGFDSWRFVGWLKNGNDTVNGSAGDDDVFGQAGNDVLKGAAGDDYFEGGAGKDSYDGGDGFDMMSFQDTAFDPTALRGIVLDAQAGTVIDAWGNSETFTSIEGFRGSHFGDTINGSALDEQFFGLGGRDKIDGKGGVDEVRYDRDNRFGGDKSVTVNLTTGIAIDGFGRQDTLVSIERMRGSDSADVLTGSSAANRIRALDGNDVLNGLAGADDMRGGAGDDTYVVDNASDIVNEDPNSDFSAGTDLVQSSITFSLADTDNVFGDVENLTLTGTAAINGTGNGLANVLTGNTANNTLTGAAGNDTLSGGDSSDTLIGGDGADKLIGGTGSDTASYAGAAATVKVSLASPATNTGAAAGDTFSSIEYLTGSSFADTLVGNTGNNVLNGGSGKDTLTGGAGADSFRFANTLNASSNVDTITDFVAADDTIQIDNAVFAALTTTGALAAAAFRANTTGLAGDANDRIIYETDTGKLFYDADGNGAGAGASILFATLTGLPAITNADFVVV